VTRSAFVRTAVVFLCVSACYTESQPVHVEEPPPPPSPPCIKEVCAQRPGWLVCETPYTGMCGKYRIAYEHHCDCVEWGPLPDGGAK
jgi:hypothetical protein